MKLIFVFFFILIPLLVLQGMSLSVVDKKVLFTKKEIAVLKGIATFLVMMSHLAYILLEDRNANINILFSIIQKSGGGYRGINFFLYIGIWIRKGYLQQKRLLEEKIKEDYIPKYFIS